MITVRLWGGLGNQMFQYAFGYAMAKKRSTELYLDTYFFSSNYQKNNRYSSQKLHLLEFPLDYKAQVNTNGEIKFAAFLQKQSINRLCKVLPSFSIKIGNNRYVKETRLTYLGEVVNLPDNNIYLDGYWQTDLYFGYYKEDIVK